MKKKVGKALAVFLCLCTILTMSDLPIRAYTEDGSAGSSAPKSASEQSGAIGSADSGSVDDGSSGDEGTIMLADTGNEAGALTMENHSLKWVSGTSTSVIDGNKITTTPSSNSDVTVKAQLTYSCGGNEGVDTGKAEIRLPLNIYYDRSGKPVGNVSLSIPKAPQTGGATSFNYTIDDHGTPDDPTDDEIVITNYKPLPEGGFFMKADIAWTYDPTQVANGYSNDQVQATFKTQGNGGGEALTGTSEKLTTTQNTKVSGNTPTKDATKKLETWKSEWGPKPADADDYYYVVWTVQEQVHNSASTSAYAVYFDEMPGAVDKEGNTVAGDKNTGEVVAWANYSFYNNGQPTANGTGKSTDFKVGTQAQMAADPAYVANNRGEINNTNSAVARDIVMRYPKSQIPEEGETPTIHNGVKVQIKTPEGDVYQRIALGQYVYQRVQLDVNYPGDGISSYKRPRAGYNSNSSKSPATFSGGLSMLKAGKEVEADWSIDVKNMGWTRTEGGTKTYDTVLRDGNMYVAGQKLLPGDYELSKFYPAQYDIIVPAYNEDQGYFLAVSGDYEKDYTPIQVEVKDASENWSHYGQIVKTGEKTYRWEGDDGTTSTGTYTENYATTNGPKAIALPAGTQDIRFTQTGKNYGVEYRMGLYYKLKPSAHLLGLVENTSTFSLININEAWGAQDGEIYTLGNTFDNTSTPTIKQDIEAQDTAEFGGTDQVLHDYSEHTFTSIKPSGAYSKSLSGPYNEPNAQRARIGVNLTWDYYYSFSALGMSLNDAIDANLIAESRDGVFYDLLPPGVDVDLSSIKARTYCGTNCDGKYVPDCEYTVEMVENWRDSGRTMMILHVKVPEGYRNFDRSTTWCDTGFKVSFNMYDSWDNIETYGIGLKNDSAFVSKDGSVPGGVSDTGEGSADKALFENLGGGDGDQDLENNVKYSSANIKVDVPRAAQMGFTKKVKGAADTGYNATTTIPATGDYTYQLRYALQDNAKATGVIMYDVLETAYDQNPHWSGTFQGINVKQIQQQFPDIDVKVYYSTLQNFGNLQATSGKDYTNLQDTSVWSATAPDDLSKVTAVAVDLSKNKDGSKTEFTGPVALSAVISMRAPANYQDYLDDPATTDTDETVYAYNQAFIKTGNEKPEGSETTTVSLKKPDISIKKLSDPVTGTNATPKNVPIGSTIDYTLQIKNNNGADTITGVKVEDVIPDGLEIDTANLAFYFGTQSGGAALADGTGRVSATVEGQKVTFTIDKLTAKELANLVIPVKVKEDNVGGTRFDNKAKITEFNEEEWGDEYESNETHHQVTNVKLALPVLKKFTGQTRPIKKTFRFELVGLNGAPMPEGADSNMLSITDGATSKAFAAINFTKAGDYQYTVTEKNDGETGYTYDTTVHHITVHVYEENERLKATWTDADAKTGDNGKIVFTNDYTPLETDFAIPVEKILGGDPVPPGHTEDFEFTLSPGASSNPMPADGKTKLVIAGLDSSANGKEKTASYDKITFTKAGTYVYTIKEKIGNTPGYKYAYDISTHTVTLKVTDNNGRLECVWKEQTAQNPNVTFRNDYAPTADIISLDVSKLVTGNDRVEQYKKSFTFELSQPTYEGAYDYAANNEALPMPTSTTTTIVDSGTAQLGQIAIKHAGTYTYTIREVNTNAAGYTYDTNVCRAVVTAVDDGGEIHATTTYQFLDKNGAPVDATQFVNKYKPAETSTSFTIKKTLTGDVPANNQKTFTFKVEPIDGAPMPANGVDTVTTTGAGTVTMENVGPYTKAGTYKYKITEEAGNEGGYTYSADQYIVTVTVEDQDGVLVATQSIKKNDEAADAIVFENKYVPTATEYAPKVSKKVTGNDRPEDQKQDFRFTLEAIGDAPMPAAGGETCTINDEGDDVFGTIKYTKAGTYKYTIKEQGGSAGGYTYSQNVCTLTVTVTDEEGVLVAATSYSNTKSQTTTEAEFTNDYTPTPVSEAIEVTKSIAGNERPEGKEKTFTFLLTGKDGAPMPTAANGNCAEITDEGTARFKAIQYTEAGVYKYEVQEVDDGLLGYSYSLDVYEVTVTVTDNHGTLEAEVSYKKGGVKADSILFENEYHPEATSATFGVEKAITGNDRSEDWQKDFTFTLTGQDDAPMPAAGGEKATVKDEGTAEFGKILFDHAGTFVYTVAEEDGGENGYTYSQAEYTVTVVVTDTDGILEKEVAITKDGEEVDAMAFENEYHPEKATLELPIEKILQGDKPAKDETFTFTLAPKDDAPMPENDSVEITGAGTVKFGEMEFTEAGTYHYTVTETPGDAEGYSYDSHTYEVEVTVTDHDGTLEATWTVDGKSADAVAFTNTYTAPKTEITKPNGGINTGDRSNMGLWLALAGTAVLALIVLLALRRKNK